MASVFPLGFGKSKTHGAALEPGTWNPRLGSQASSSSGEFFGTFRLGLSEWSARSSP